MSRLSACLAFCALTLLAADAAAQTFAETAPLRLARWDENDLPGHLYPTDVARGDNGRIYLLDAGGPRVVMLRPDGLYLGEWGDYGSNPGEFVDPRGIAVGPDGSVYVSDTGNQRVQKFDADGNYLDECDSFHNGYQWVDFVDPRGLTCGPDGDLYVIDRMRHGVFRFRDDFTYVTACNGGPGPDENLREPEDVAVDALGRTYVADTGNDRVMKLSATFQLLAIWEHDDLPVDDAPAGLAVDDGDRLYIAFHGDDRLVKLDGSGNWLSEFPPQGSTESLRQPLGVDVFGNGTIHVVTEHDHSLSVLGYPPVIAAIDDVPDDQGRWVRLTWLRSELDRWDIATAVTGYAVYRRQPGAAAPLRHAPDAVPGVTGEKGMVGWDAIATVPARGDSVYALVAPTLVDSTGTDPGWSVFAVAAFMSDGDFHDSAPDSGRSVDDIAPPPPAAPTVTEQPGLFALAVAWQHSPAPDLDHYAVYRGATSEFLPADPEACIATTTAPSFVDDTVAAGETWYYRVAAFDDAQTFSGYSDAAGARVISAAGGPPRASWRLAQNAPNPFNPRTVIPFELAAPARVTLRVFDTRGCCVRTLLAREARDAGPHTAVWCGRDDAGRCVAAGVYVYRLDAGDFRATRRMVLMK